MKLVNREFLSREDVKMCFEQYKLYVEMADRVSQRRMNVNTFFISVNTLLLTIVSFSENTTNLCYLLFGIFGDALCFMWYFTLNSYRQLNSGKFKVILEVEKLLPLSGYTYEWEFLEEGKKTRKYWLLSNVEKVVPIIFCIIYIFFTIYKCKYQCNALNKV